MSGPKTSRYTLTEAQRKWLEEQQRIRREISVAHQKRIDLSRTAEAEIEKIQGIIRKIKDFQTISGMKIELISSLEDMICTEQDNIRTIKSGEESLENLNADNQNLDCIIKSLVSLRKKAKEEKDKLESTYRDELTNVITVGFSKNFSSVIQNKKAASHPYIKKIREVFERVEQMDLPQDLLGQLHSLQKKSEEIENMDYLENFCNMQVYPFLHTCEFYLEYHEEFEDLMREYNYLLSEVGEIPKAYQISPAGIEELRKEVQRLTDFIIHQKEQSYICETIDQIMIEMGYDLAGSREVVKKNGRCFHNGLYVLEEGIGVNVTFSDTGQIAMELGALDEEDRYPSDEEARELVEDMSIFCERYKEIEERLNSHGIISKHVQLLPASVEYAQIINTMDYDLKKPVSNYKRRKEKKEGKEKSFKVMENGKI